jgi:hypothetical protein
MKTFNLNIDYKLKYPVGSEPTPEKLSLGQAELTRDYIEYAISSSYKDGLDSQFRRIYATIQSKIESAIEDKTYFVELADSEVKFIKDAFSDDKAKFNATIAKYVVALEDAISSL